MRKIIKFFERPHRSLTKAITFRILIIITNGLLVFLLTHRIDLTASVIGFQTLVNTILYVVHERVWNQIHWGKHDVNI